MLVALMSETNEHTKLCLFLRDNFTLKNMTEAVLLDAGMPKDAAGIVLKHKAAITLQSFFPA